MDLLHWPVCVQRERHTRVSSPEMKHELVGNDGYQHVNKSIKTVMQKTVQCDRLTAGQMITDGTITGGLFESLINSPKASQFPFKPGIT